MLAQSSTSDEDLVARVRNGSMDALAALYNSYAGRVYGVALRYVHEVADAQDVVHDVFVGLPHALTRYTPRGAFWAWLRQVTVRVCLMKLRAARKQMPTALQPAAAFERHRDLHDVITAERVVSSLPESLRLVFLLKEVEGYSHNEIADLLNITVAGSTLRLYRAWQLVRKQLEHAR